MSSPFDDWSIEDARIAVQLSSGRASDLASYTGYVEGDHWQDWKGWIGPCPLATDTDAQQVRNEIQKGFISRNAIGECVGRHINGVLGRDVKWTLMPRRSLAEGEQPNPQEKALIDEAETLLKEWVTARKLNQEFDRKVGQTLLIAGQAFERPFVPPGELAADGTIPATDMATSLGRVYVHFPLPGEATIWTDQRTQRKCSVYYYKEVNSSRPSESMSTNEERAELTYLDGDVTVVRIVGKEGTISRSEEPQDFRFQLGNRLLMADLHRKPLLNPQVVSQQKLLNLALTMKERNVILGGFLERVATNAQMDGSYQEVGGQRVFVPNPIPVGAGAMTTLTGYILHDADGNESIATPSMLWRDPVDVKTFLDTERSSYEYILAECNQLHYAMSADATASGESRIIAMAAYLIDLLQTKQQIDAAWAWLLETALALAAVLSGQSGRFDLLRVNAECSVDPGPVSADLLRAVQQLTGNQQLLSQRTGRKMIGVEDLDGEAQQIASEQEEQGNSADLTAVQGFLDRARGNGGANGAVPNANGAQPANAAQNGAVLPANQQQQAA
jgi:hypothetical protein